MPEETNPIEILEDASLPGWRRPVSPSPPPSPTSEPGPSPSSSPTPTSEAAEGLPPLGPVADPAPPSSTPASTDALDHAARLLVGLAGLGLHWRLSPGANTGWIPTEDETADIAAPLARIAARRLPVGTGVPNDLADGAEALLASGNYALRNLTTPAEPLEAPAEGPEEPAPYASPA